MVPEALGQPAHQPRARPGGGGGLKAKVGQLLDDDEAIAIAVGLRTAARATLTLPDGGPSVDPQTLGVIAAARHDTELVRFADRRGDGAKSRREVEPHSLVNLGRRWYLLAWDCGRGLASLRLDRRRRSAPLLSAEPFRGAGHAPRLRRGDPHARALRPGDDRADRRGELRIPAPRVFTWGA